MTTSILSILMVAIPAVILLFIVFWLLSLRRIVPTNMVHILQRGKNTVSYGVGKLSNVYYAFPRWMPVIGVEVRSLPVSNFDVELIAYSAYDKDRVPFVVDIKAFFHIADTNKAAEKVESFEDLKGQLINIVQGTVRSILAKSTLESIMEERSVFGEQFTQNVKEDLKNWGVEAVKSIELMDVRDAEKSNVIHQIMAKRMSAIDMESRIEVAKNRMTAENSELESQQAIDIKAAETQKASGEAQAKSKQAIAIAQAESEKEAGIAQQESTREIAKAEKITAEHQMEVKKVNEVKQAEINKEKAIVSYEQDKKRIEINAEADKFQTETNAAAALLAKQKEAEGIKVTGEAEAYIIESKGKAEAESKKLMEIATVTAQTTLAKEIGENRPYQEYLIEVKKVEVSQVIGVANAESMATALSSAEMKLLINSGDVHSGMNKITDLFTSKGGSALNGLMEVLKQTPEGRGILSLLPTAPAEKETLAPKGGK
jgi:flotillin